jgi:hypothetical protein
MLHAVITDEIAPFDPEVLWLEGRAQDLVQPVSRPGFAVEVPVVLIWVDERVEFAWVHWTGFEIFLW